MEVGGESVGREIWCLVPRARGQILPLASIDNERQSPKGSRPKVDG